MLYYTIKQELIENKIILKTDMYLLEGKLLFTNNDAFEKVKHYFESKGLSLITGNQRKWTHWKKTFTKYMYFKNLPHDPKGILISLEQNCK